MSNFKRPLSIAWFELETETKSLKSRLISAEINFCVDTFSQMQIL